MKRALVIGSAGQDGAYLSSQLAADGWSVTGVDRATERRCDLRDAMQTDALIREEQPDALYFLAAHHHSSQDPARAPGPELLESLAIHVEAWVHVLDGLTRHAPRCRAFYAASSHVFGTPRTPMINEASPLAPETPYAITKAAGVEVGRLYRARGLHVSSGFLFNHESPRRADRFVSQKIVLGAVAAARAAKRGQHATLELGNLSAVVDWGYAPDYTRAMQLMTAAQTPADYVVASGVPHTPADFCRVAFEAVGLDWRQHVVERQGALSRQPPPLLGDASALKAATGWAPSITFDDMVRVMISAAQQREESAQ